MEKLTCDKPYNLDAARKARGLPRKRRKDPNTTCYELCIRIPEQYQDIAGQKKYSKTVYVLNKKTDLKEKVKAFENAKTEELESLVKADSSSNGEVDLDIDAHTSLRVYLQYYCEVRAPGLSKETVTNEASNSKYICETLGEIPLGKLSSNDIERAIKRVPELSERWAVQLREERERKRSSTNPNVHHRKLKPLKPIRVAGPDKQYKVLKFMREALNFAVDKEVLDRNVAKAKFLSRLFKKSKPLIDPLMEDEAGRLLGAIELLPTSFEKVAYLLLLNTGIRPEEVQAVRLGNFVYIDNEPCVSITGIVEHGTTRIKNYEGKSNASLRSIPIDDYTYQEVLKWADLLKLQLAEMGIKFTLSTPLITITGIPFTYNTLNKRWKAFVRKAGFEGTRMYALRHTFATITLAHGENIKTVSYLMGHESTAYTTDLYAAWVPNTRTGIGRRYMDTLRKAA